MIISISGAQGSGKSTIAKMLSEKLSWPRYYMGGLRRLAAKKRGMTLADYNKLGETDIKTDQEIDDYQQKLGHSEDNFIIEGRTSWYFIPQSLKLYFDVSLQEGARRIFQQLQKKNSRNEDHNLNSVQAVQGSMKKRLASDSRRYWQYYKIDVNDLRHYDFYLNTDHLSIEEVFKTVNDWLKMRLDNQKN